MGKLPRRGSIWSFRRMRKEARWKRAPPNSWNRFRDFLLKIERIWSLFENDPLALKARRAKPVGGGARGGERGGACGARLLRRIGWRVWRLAVRRGDSRFMGGSLACESGDSRSFCLVLGGLSSKRRIFF